jgi:magnesium-transporting ATPase (P-type)
MLTLVLILLHSPTPPGVVSAVIAQAGIRVVVVTGDNQATAEAVCRSIGALGVDSGLDEQQLSSLTGGQGFRFRVQGKKP